MNRHLNDQEITEWMLSPGTRNDHEIAEHLRACITCSEATHELRDVLACYRDTIVEAAERDANFWARQRIGIEERLRPRSHSSLLRWAVNALAVLVLLAAFMLLRAPQPAPRAGNDLSDDALLQEVQSDTDRDFPVALAPAAIIDNERTLALSNTSVLTPLNQKEQQR